jgi:hypothetical protein
MAQGVEVIQGSGARGQGSEEQLFANPFERHEHLIKKEARGEVLTPEEVQFLAWYREEYAEVIRQMSEMGARGRLAAVE